MTIPTVELDIQTLTLGEVWEVEKASGQDFKTLVERKMGQRLVVLYVSRLRSDGQAPSWPDLLNLRVLDSTS